MKMIKIRSFTSMLVSIYACCSCIYTPSFEDSPVDIRHFRFSPSEIAASEKDSFGDYQRSEALLYDDGSMYIVTRQSIIKSDDFPRHNNTIFITDSLLFVTGWDDFDKSYAIGNNCIYGGIWLDYRKMTPGSYSPIRVFSFDVDSHEMRLSEQTFQGIKSLWLGSDGQVYVLEQGRVLWMLDKNFEAKRIRDFPSFGSAGRLSDGYWIAEEGHLEIVRNDSSLFFDLPNVEGVLDCGNNHLCVICIDRVSKGITAFHIVNNSIEDTSNNFCGLTGVCITHACSSGDNLVLGLFTPTRGILCSSDGGYTWTLCKGKVSTDLTEMTFRDGILWVWEAW